MFSTKLRGGKAFATKQKIRGFKKLLLKVNSQKYGVLQKRLRKNLSKTENFEKVMIFIEWLELAEMQKDANVTTFVSIRKLDSRRKS